MKIIAYLPLALGLVFVMLPVLYLFVGLSQFRTLSRMKRWEFLNGAGIMLGIFPLIGVAAVSYLASLLEISNEHLIPLGYTICLPILVIAIISSATRLIVHYGVRGGSRAKK